MNYLVQTIKSDDVKHLRAHFDAIDTDKSGMIDAQELQNYLKKMKMNVNNNEALKLIEELDYQGNGKINYSEFLAATIDCNKFLTDQRLAAIFQQFDTDNTKKITAQNLKSAFEKMGIEISLEELTTNIRLHDKSGQDMVDFQTFKAMFYQGESK